MIDHEIEKQYELGITDEFVEPLIADTFNGINDDDSLFFANFRADRAGVAFSYR